jgi:hypothetical protein
VRGAGRRTLLLPSLRDPGRPLTRVPTLASGRPRTCCSSASRTSRPVCARGGLAASARRRCTGTRTRTRTRTRTLSRTLSRTRT